MKKFLAGFLVFSLALNIFLWTRISNQASQLKSLQANANDAEELRRQIKELQLHPASDSADASAADARELIRLRNQVGLLRQQAGDAKPLRAPTDDAELRTRLVGLMQDLANADSILAEVTKLSPQELAALKQDAQSTACVNNLKQIGLSARIWAGDNNDVFPKDFISMTNELGSPNVLICPSANIPRMKNWAELNPALISYRFMNPGGTEINPDKVLAMCPIHGHVCMSDGSVQRKR